MNLRFLPPTFFRSLFCLATFYFFAHSYVNAHNTLISLQKHIPKLQSELSELTEEVQHLSYELELEKSPKRLLKEVEREEFKNMGYPSSHDLIIIDQ